LHPAQAIDEGSTMTTRTAVRSIDDAGLTSGGPHPVRRAIVALLLGIALGLAAALLQPRDGKRSRTP
jgi:hypothetical protein